jgi:DNA-binding transcriptional LysR family regulator
MLKQIDLSRADLNLLVLFETVREQKHVGRAAEALNLSPSAVSHDLNRLRRLLNDPLFLKTPRGVVPTARAAELAEPITEILARVRSVVSTAEPFVAARSRRRFVVGAPDAISAVLAPLLLKKLRSVAPGIDLSVRQILPPQQSRVGGNPWEPGLEEIEARLLDVAILPIDEVPARFMARKLYEEEFVVAMRAGHPFAAAPTLDNYCKQRHLVVSLTRDNESFVDKALAEKGRERRVALAVPNFMMALTLLAESDFVAAVPRSLVAAHSRRFGLTNSDAPLPLRRFVTQAVTTRSAMMDAGVAWLFDLIAEVAPQPAKGRAPRQVDSLHTAAPAVRPGGAASRITPPRRDR